MKKTALVIGSGDFEKGTGFGRWHVKNLASINEVKKVIVTNTTIAKALRNVEILGIEYPGKVFKPYEISNESDLEKAISDFNPDFASVVGRSRDEEIQDTLHAKYAFTILNASDKCQAFVEKPFSMMKDAELMLKELDKLTDKQKTRLSMNLPMYFAQEELRQKGINIADANSLNIFWSSKPKTITSPVVDDLILHAYSLLPSGYTINIKKIYESYDKNYASLDLELLSKNKTIPCSIILRYGDTKRNILIDSDKFVNVVNGDQFNLGGDYLFNLENPLNIGLEASLSEKPVVGLNVIRESQEFLSQIHKYRQ